LIGSTALLAVLVLDTIGGIQKCGLTVCVSRKWAGVDKVWEQDSTEALKTAKKRGESHLSAARCVGLPTEFIHELPTPQAAYERQPNHLDLPRPY
jgi:hypothetical protein